ncbi:MAG: hypothetical protein AAGD22_05845 [Verrucomicrobiota bacterium]
MKVRPHSPSSCRRGYAVLIVVNVLVLVLVLSLVGAYYFYRLSAGKAIEEFSEGDRLERAGDYAGAEAAYAEAVRLDPLNARYKRRMHQAEFREEQLRGTEALREGVETVVAPENEVAERAEAGSLRPQRAHLEPLASTDHGGEGLVSEGSGAPQALSTVGQAVSGDLWPEELQGSGLGSIDEGRVEENGSEEEDLVIRGEKEKQVSETKAFVDESVASSRAVRLFVDLPNGVEFRIEAVLVEGLGPGKVLYDWSKGGKVVDVDWQAGRYAILARTGTLTPWREEFEIVGTGEEGAPEEHRFAYSMVKISGDPVEADVYYGATEKRMGVTPYTLVRPPTEIKLTLRAKGYVDEVLNLDLSGGEVVELAPRLKEKARAAEPISKLVAELDSIDEREPPLFPKRPMVGEPFMGGNGVVFEFRSKSSRGDPFWRSETVVLDGMSDDEVAVYCRGLNTRERAAGRVPSGYAYFPSLARDGRLVLARDYSKADRPGSASPLSSGDPVVRVAEPIAAPPASSGTGLGGEIRFGNSFRNSAGMTMTFREADYRGNPYWRSEGAVLAGMASDEVANYLWGLTRQERLAGTLPSGYAYAKELGDTGRYVLVRTDVTRVRVIHSD